MCFYFCVSFAPTQNITQWHRHCSTIHYIHKNIYTHFRWFWHFTKTIVKAQTKPSNSNNKSNNNHKKKNVNKQLWKEWKKNETKSESLSKNNLSTTFWFVYRRNGHHLIYHLWAVFDLKTRSLINFDTVFCLRWFQFYSLDDFFAGFLDCSVIRFVALPKHLQSGLNEVTKVFLIQPIMKKGFG